MEKLWMIKWRLLKRNERIKFKSFGKVKIGRKGKVKSNENNRSKSDAKDQYEEEEARASLEVEGIKSMKLSKVGKIWEIRKRILGGDKGHFEATAITNPLDGKLVVSRESIKRITLQYCTDTLGNNIPESEFQSAIENKQTQVRKRLMEIDGSFSPQKETFECLIDKFKRSRKPNYHFLVRAGKDFQNTVFNFCQMMMTKEEFPSSFRETTLHMIFAGP